MIDAGSFAILGIVALKSRRRNLSTYGTVWLRLLLLYNL
jgi:hypothetical protein